MKPKHTTCTVEGCGKGGKIVRGMCMTHYQRWKRHGDTGSEIPIRRHAPDSGCSIPGCERPHYGHDLCQKHYRRQRLHGDADTLLIGQGLSAEQRFWRFVERNTEGCWSWTGSKDEGYGRFGVDGRTVRAHRFSYELHHGPIPDGMVVMHKCDNPQCTNPGHLELGTLHDNALDMVAKGRHWSQRRRATM